MKRDELMQNLLARVAELECVLDAVCTEIQRRLDSDDVCDLPFDEDLAGALKIAQLVKGESK